MRGKAQRDSPVRAVGVTWRIRLNDHATSGPKYDVHTALQADLICCFDVIVRLPKMTYPHPGMLIYFWKNEEQAPTFLRHCLTDTNQIY